MSNIVAINGGVLGKVAPDKEIIEMLEKALVQANNGDLRGIAIILIDDESRIFTRSHSIYSKHLLVAGSLYLQHDLTKPEEE